MKKDVGGPGMTWEQLDFFIEAFRKKEITVIEQEHDQ
jgi:hypothetical protein